MIPRKLRIYILITGTILLLTACSSVSSDATASTGQQGQNQSSQSSSGEEMAEESSNPSNTPLPVEDPLENYRIITLLPQDAIPAIDNPEYYSVEEADQEYDPYEQVIGIVFNGEARAYSTGLLSRHEIVNDTVGGVKLSVTW
ncbi:MAG: DUF3179 domain-containing protein [Chloroflexi bacterium]|nr:DUF3179 domain-containing protein [Chloroflexota bacterium]